ncbi:MAG: alkylmercury lyase family protein [Conexivisphaerales archaeon]
MAENLAKEVRKYIFDYFLDNSRAPVLEEIMDRFGLPRNEAARVLEELEVAHHVIRVPGTNRILMANPFSALDTPFRVKVGRKGYFAACAWDAVAYHIMLARDTQVDSFCHHCAEPIRIKFSKGRAKFSIPSDPLVYLSLPAARWWENIVITCANHMVFFSSRKHLDDWLEKNPSLGGEALSLDQTLKISIPIYRNKMRLDYARPTKDELMNYWGSIELKGDFWKV